MLMEHSCFDIPVRFDDPEALSIDLIKQVYSFYPEALSNELQEDDELERQLFELPRLIEEYSRNPNNSTAYLLRKYLRRDLICFMM